MRTLLLASLVLAPACLIGTGDISGGGDDQKPGVCGDGVVNTGETCDDGNTNGGDGCSATCQTESSAPHVAISVDKSTVTSDLNVESSVTVTATSQNGFSGNVTLTVASDASGVPITDWVTNLDNPTLALAPGASATAVLKISAMGDAAMLAGSVKITATGGDVPVDATVATTFNAVLAITFADAAGTCNYPIGHTVASPYLIKTGRQIAIYNGSATLGMVIHTNAQIAGFPHEDPRVAPGTTPGTAHTATITGVAGDEDQFYCHGDTGLMQSGQAATYPYLRVAP
jgi:cysteine-rich repeat protein